MDDELESLEAELKQLRPVPPSAALEARIARELAAPSRAKVTRGEIVAVPWLWRVTLPIAAALAVFALVPRGRDAAPSPRAGRQSANGSPGATAAARGGVLKPVSAEKVLYAAQDEGLVTLEDGTTARRERLSYVDTITWKNPRTNASLTWSVPREEVRVVPVRFQ